MQTAQNQAVGFYHKRCMIFSRFGLIVVPTTPVPWLSCPWWATYWDLEIGKGEIMFLTCVAY